MSVISTLATEYTARVRLSSLPWLPLLMRDRPSKIAHKIAQQVTQHIARPETPGLAWPLPRWVWLSLTGNGVLSLLVLHLIWQQHHTSPTAILAQPRPATAAVAAATAVTTLGPRQQLTYDQWVDLLRQEARVAAEHPVDHLAVLLGDSLSLWFPQDLLPTERAWLNQGISGETSDGLRQRLNLIDQTRPQTILVMIGINDLIRGVDDAVLLDNYRAIISHLQQAHPDTQIVIQSILPHAGTDATWEGRDRLLTVPNSRIRHLNEALKVIAADQGIDYLDLYTVFADTQDNLHSNLSTDGLHLNPQGYLVWRTVLQLYLRAQG